MSSINNFRDRNANSNIDFVFLIFFIDFSFEFVSQFILQI